MTIEARLLEAMRVVPFKSAHQLARIVCADSSSVSSILRRLALRGVVNREKGLGPRGGYGYTLNKRR